MTETDQAILGYMMQPYRRVADKTRERIADAAGVSGPEAARRLRVLEERGLVHADVDATLGTRVWFQMPAAADAMET